MGEVGRRSLDIQEIISLDTWITSDQHWGHPRIQEYQNRPADHFQRMRSLWFTYVHPDDVLLHLGDIVCFGDRKKHPYWIGGLTGKKYLIRGNHDYQKDSWYEAFGFTVLGRGDRPFWWVAPDGTLVAFSHEPLIDQDQLGWDLNIHGHIHGNTHLDVPNGEKYRNVSVEVTQYAPVRLNTLLLSYKQERKS